MAEFLVRIPEELYAWVDSESRRLGLSKAELVRLGLAGLRNGKGPTRGPEGPPTPTGLARSSPVKGSRRVINVTTDDQPPLVHEWAENPHFGKVCRVCKLPKGNTGPVCGGEAT